MKYNYITISGVSFLTAILFVIVWYMMMLSMQVSREHEFGFIIVLVLLIFLSILYNIRLNEEL